ncbi:MAG: tol-pal system protein YbgF [Gallionella sp.]|nr:tol-pal system protein YbgF [Gallionella sp.]
MLRLCALILLGLCLAAPAQAGLFSDEGARKQIKQLEAQVLAVEDALNKQTGSLLDLQGQIDALNGEIRKLRGQNEEVVHGLQDAEKRQKDFYVDLDTRLRHFESAEETAVTPIAEASPAEITSADPHDPVPENRAFENAYDFLKRGNHAEAVKALREFIKKYPDSVHAPNANYWLGNAQFALKDYKGALSTYQGLLKDFPGASRTADTYLNVAECRRELNQKDEAQKTLKQLIAKYPDSQAAAKAKKLLSVK